MAQTQDPPHQRVRFDLHSERLGPLPLINHFLQRLDLEALLDKYVPTIDRRCAVPHARALGVVLRSIIVEREPIYREQETVHGFAQGLFGLSTEEMEHLSDDRIGRALDRLFDADRAVLLTEVVVAVGQRFGVTFDECHNDSTTISFCGQYRAATRHAIRGRAALAITYGHSKARRPDLKQLLFILTVTAEGVPCQFRCADGNTNDSVTHIDTWNALRAVAGRADFLYIADSKLCSRDNLDYIDRAGGRFVTVLPRSRLEDELFRKWIQTNTPPWELVWVPTLITATGPVTAGTSIGRCCPPWKPAASFGFGAACSRCISMPGGTRTLPRPAKNSRRCALGSPAPERACAERRKSTWRWLRYWSSTMSAAT